ncbi:RNA ligase family protein [Actinophytocola oryzae]|uniref:Putative kinase n=1 Tax=Actinophytocola oryzae TaxID=502181 RepID=A0A4V3FTR7_9PSEU|nr:RNA ligase family protein [Actinophytocola oryzae]TDV52361.1 putative kinase [Actinophytocola oryzae]
MRVHYPRTSHLPWSPGASSDDVRTTDLSGLAGREVVVTEKLDGENTTLYADGLHARSLDSAHHPSRAWVKSLQGLVGPSIPAGWRVCGENLYARHSLAYHDLDSWFSAFSVWDGDFCLDWDATVRFCADRGLPTPPVLWRGVFDEKALRGLRLDLTRQEGFVVRAVAGFTRDEFSARVAKWVRRGHVQTDQHWMQAPVVVNGRGAAAALWDVRAGFPVDVPALLAAVDMRSTNDLTRLDLLGRTGDARLAGVLATLLHACPRPRVMARLARLGLPLARRVADLVGLHPLLYRDFPDEARRAGLTRLAMATDLGVLHAVAAAVGDTQAVEWSRMHAEEAGLLGPDPWRPLRDALTDLAPGDVRDRCFAEARTALADGRLHSPEEVPAATWRWRAGDFPRLIVLVGPAGSGKSTFVTGQEVDDVVSMDALRDSGDQRANPAVLREALGRLDRALARGGTVVWDATALNRHQRSTVATVAAGRNALVTHAVVVVEEEEAARRNAARSHPVPPAVLSAQFARFVPPYPGEAHRTWYVGAAGTVEDVDDAHE